eukprot:6685546-Prymnesium_polylepis.2
MASTLIWHACRMRRRSLYEALTTLRSAWLESRRRSRRDRKGARGSGWRRRGGRAVRGATQPQ